MPKHLFPSNGEILYTATATDQGKALDECVEWASKRFVLVSIIHKCEEEGKHVFTVNYLSKIDASGNSDPDVQKS
jgi:hypothetical protein